MKYVYLLFNNGIIYNDIAYKSEADVKSVIEQLKLMLPGDNFTYCKFKLQGNQETHIPAKV